MADRKLRVLLKKIYSNGDKDTIFFKSRAKDVFIDEDGSTTLQDTVDKVNAIQSGATKVEDSNTNGNIKINGAETNVYTHPNSGVTAGTYNKVTVNAQGHVTSASNVTNWTGTVSGDISNATATFTTASSRANITSGANIKTTLGKIAKYFADLKSLAFVDKVGTANLDTTLTTAYNNRVTTDKVTTSTSITASGWVADARAIATLQNQINTINSNLDNKVTKRALGEFTNIEVYGVSSPFIDFHYDNSESDYTSRIAEYSNGRLTIEAPNGINISSDAELQVNGTGVSLSSHNHDTRYPKWYRCANLRLYPGTKVITGISSQYSQQLIGFDELNDVFGVSNCGIGNTACFASNGDWVANECQVTSFAYTNGWHVIFSTNISGQVRISFLIIYFS